MNFSFASAEPGYFEMPDLLVNLYSDRGVSSILKIRVSLDLEDASDIPHLKQVMPRIVDNMQTYLRELRVEDLQGARGLRRLQNEMLARVNSVSGQAKVSRILFKELLVQ
ncbi:MAG: flagellar basal body-associated FliL family protein [Rhodospirillales bacterium]|nr:flagellar basal body-associated FliL family protein [Rhodospirillales bacterium]MDP6774311.1 flagellar basal body-associated FliL family protein [Rhodospirillales bacterium]